MGNCRKLCEMAGNGGKWQEMTGNGEKLGEVAVNGGKLCEMAYHLILSWYLVESLRGRAWVHFFS